MTLQQIEEQVLAIIGYDRYADISASTDVEKIADFALLHRCVTAARNELIKGASIPAVLQRITAITTVAGTRQYTVSNADFNVPVKARYRTTDGEAELERINPDNLLDKVGDTTAQGTPSYYMMFGATAAGLSYVELYPIPDAAGTLDIDYKPVLTNLTASTSEDVLMLRYPETVIKFASAWAFQIIKKDGANFDKWLLMAKSDFRQIQLAEMAADSWHELHSDSLLISRRTGRAS